MTHVDIEALSGICGSISIACWVVVFSPQIIENFRRSSAEGLSIVFLVIWLAGDIFNILGAVLQGVLPTMIILAVYYTLADIVLILQCFYYRGFTLKDTVRHETPTTESANGVDGATETSALLRNQTDSAGGQSMDGTHLSPTTPLHPQRDPFASLKGPTPAQERKKFVWTILVNSTAILLVCAAGALGWWFSMRGPDHSHKKPKHDHRKHEDGTSQRSDLEFSLLGQIFGYICAVLYLGSRAPQLLLNYRRKSTEGISMLFFIFACIGNATYVVSILAYEPSCLRESQNLVPHSNSSWLLKHDKDYGCKPGEAGELYARNMLVNLSWLIGSFGTLLLDAAVFFQWYIYRGPENNRKPTVDENHNQESAEGD